MKPSTKRILAILMAMVMFIGSLIVYNFLIQPSYSEIKDLRAGIASRINLIQENESSINQVRKLLAEYQNVSQLQEIASFILPPKQNISQTVRQITGLAEISGLNTDFLTIKVLAIEPSAQSTVARGRGTLRSDIRLAGSYENLKSFLQNIETNMSLIDLITLKMEPLVKTGASGNNFYFTITLDTYYQTE